MRIRNATSVWALMALVWVSLFAATAETIAARPRGYVLEIHKTKRRMELWYDGQLLREFEISLGRSPKGRKEIQGDKRTPEGRYLIVEKHVSRRFHRFLGINYPNADDASRGYEDRLVSARLWADLFVAEERGQAPSWSTPLGGRIGIHGFGGRPYIPSIDWTDGCIAVSDEESEYLYGLLPIGTWVVINE